MAVNRLGFDYNSDNEEYINAEAGLSIFNLSHSWKLCKVTSEFERELIESFESLSDAYDFCDTQREDLGII